MARRIRTNMWIAALMVLLCCAAALGAQAPDWKAYKYADDGFSASFPSAPELSKRNVDTTAGAFELRSYIAQVGQSALFVGVCDYGAKTAGRDPDEVLQGTKSGALENSKSHLVREQKITLGIYHGLEFESESDATENKAHFYARIYFVGSTLYQTLTVSPVGTPYPDTVRFLDSFQLIARTAP